jgi:hypothetical protein
MAKKQFKKIIKIKPVDNSKYFATYEFSIPQVDEMVGALMFYRNHRLANEDTISELLIKFDNVERFKKRKKSKKSKK